MLFFISLFDFFSEGGGNRVSNRFNVPVGSVDHQIVILFFAPGGIGIEIVERAAVLLDLFDIPHDFFVADGLPHGTGTATGNLCFHIGINEDPIRMQIS